MKAKATCLVLGFMMIMSVLSGVSFNASAGPILAPVVLDASDMIGTVYEDSGSAGVGLVANGTIWNIGSDLSNQFNIAQCPEEMGDGGQDFSISGGYDWMVYDAGSHISLGDSWWPGGNFVSLTRLESGKTYTHMGASVTTTTNYSAASIHSWDVSNPQWLSDSIPTLEPIPQPAYAGVLTWGDWIDPITRSVCVGWNVYYSDTGVARSDFILDGTAPAGPGNWAIIGHLYYVIEPLWDNSGGSPSYYANYLFSTPLLIGHWEAMATGPEGPSNPLGPFDITFDEGCAGPTELYYSSDNNMTWNHIADVPWLSGGANTYSWTAPGPGEYYWIAAGGCPDPWWMAGPPIPGTPAEAGPYTIDIKSQVDAITPYWDNISPRNITASETGPLENVTLWYRFSPDNASWNAWTPFGLDIASPWEWDFNMPDGEGYYEFFSIANDTIGGQEPMKTTAEASCGHDISPPYNGLFIPPPYWHNQNPYTIFSPLVDELSGMAPMQDMWFDYSPDGFTWFGWMIFGSSTDETWDFTWPMGVGHYKLIFTGSDIAGNNRGVPMFEDMALGFDDQAPDSWIDPIAPIQIGPTVLLDATAVDNGPSGISDVECWYSFEGGPWSPLGSDFSPPYQWTFDFPDGGGYYEFFSIATDNAGNEEGMPAGNDTWCLLWPPPSLAPAEGLRISKSGADDLLLTWTNPTASDFWDIYQSSDKYTVREPANLIATVPNGTGTYTNLTAQSDGYNWFYLVIGRGSDASEAGNSTMVYKIVNTLYSNDPASGVPNVNFVSMPWDTYYYPDSFSIITDIEGSTGPTGNGVPWNITALQRWDATTYGFASTSSYIPFPFEQGWVNNFFIYPGDGIALTLMDFGAPYPSTWDWVMIGSDVIDTFTLYSNDPTGGVPNVNFVSVPITADYPDSFSIIADIEGSTAATGNGVPWNITALQRWDATSYGFSSTSSYAPGPFPAEGWTNNFLINPGDGIALTLMDFGAPYPSTWDWTISLITPVVP
ncbi:MAG: hypothetical protein KAS67_07155 [Thermoplasmata archaeon]|nr:hypothetical protein [Thermoplasmata archaeon]